MRIPISVRSRWLIAAVLTAVTVGGLGLVVLVEARSGGDGPQWAAGPTTPSMPTEPVAAPSSPGPGTTSPPRATPPSTPPPTTVAPTTGPPAPPPQDGVPQQLRGQDVTVLPTGRQVVALTFDAGANADAVPSILGTLADAGIRATFFLTGRWAADYPAAVRAIVAAGHRVGNHSVSHPHFTELSADEIRQEVLGAEQTLAAEGADTRPLFRFPFGDRDARTIAAVNDLGYVAVRWTVDTLGWAGNSRGMSAQKVADRALGGLRPGEIVLMHVGSNPDDGTTYDADALPDVIERMRAAGYDFVTLDALLG